MSLATQALARTLCAMLRKDGADPTALLVASGILEVQEGGHHVLNRKALKTYFVDHVVMCEGHCVNAYWPRGRHGDHVYKVCGGFEAWILVVLEFTPLRSVRATW